MVQTTASDFDRLIAATRRMEEVGWYSELTNESIVQHWLDVDAEDMNHTVGTPDSLDLESAFMLTQAAIALNGVQPPRMIANILRLVIRNLEARYQ